MFVLDTNILSAFRRKKPHPSIARWLAQTGWQDLSTTVATVTEIQRGIERARAQHPATAAEVETWLTGLIALGAPQVLPMNVEAARLLGRMYECPPLRHFIVTDPTAKKPATGIDLAIAAIAIEARAAVATNNVEHFLQINRAFPLPGLFDPIHQTWHVPQSKSPH